MTLTTTLDARFGQGGFDLDASISGLSDVLGAVGLPTLSFAGDIDAFDLDGIGLDGTAEALTSVLERLGGVTGALPDLDALLAPLRSALAVIDVVGSGEIPALLASFGTMPGPSGPGLPALFDAASRIGNTPGVQSVLDIVGPLGLDLRSPGVLVGGPAGGLISLVQVIGALVGVDTTSREIEERSSLAIDLLSADRIASLIAAVGGDQSLRLAALLTGIDPNDANLVDIVARPVELHLANVSELLDRLVRGLAFAEATLVDADFPALVAGLTLASVALSSSALDPVRSLVDTLLDAAAPLLSVEVPQLGADTVWGATATLASQMEAAIAGIPPEALRQLVDPILAPVLAPVRAVHGALDEIGALLTTVLDPVRQAIDAIDLSSVADAIHLVVAPLSEVVAGVSAMIDDASTEVRDAVDVVDGLLAPVRDGLVEVRDLVVAPFESVSDALASLDLAGLSDRIETTLISVADALNAIAVKPIFDMASGVITTTADALGLVPRALLPDELEAALEAACAPVESLDLEPIRIELDNQLQGMISGLDTSVLDTVAAGYADVTAFLASINPRPPLEALEAEAFAALLDALSELDPAALLEPVTAALDEVTGALDSIDLDELFEPIDAAIATVVDALNQVSPDQLIVPVGNVLHDLTDEVESALGLSTWRERLDDAETVVITAAQRLDPTAVFAAMRDGWTDVVDTLRPRPGGGQLGAAVFGTLLGPLPYKASAAGINEVITWVRGDRDGADVVRRRLISASSTLATARHFVDTIDVRSLTVGLDAGHRAMTAALAAHPADSVLVARLAPMLAASSPTAALATVLRNVDEVSSVISSSASLVAATTGPDRSEVTVVASGLAVSFAPLSPVVEKARSLLVAAGADPDERDPRNALADALTAAGADAVIGPIESIATSIVARIVDLLHDGLFGPLREGVVELEALLDSVGVEGLAGGVTELHGHLVERLRSLSPSVALAEPIQLLDEIRTTLAGFDPFAPVREAIDDLRALVTEFAEEFRPTTLFAPVLSVYDQVAALIGDFDVAVLLTPVLSALRVIGTDVDTGMNDVIDALGRLQEACESDGGPIPGLDLSIAASVDAGGGFGL